MTAAGKDGALARSAAASPDDRNELRRSSGERVDSHSAAHEIYRDCSPRLVRRLTRQTGCRDLALELVHEAFSRLLRMAPARYLAVEHPEAYLARISTNLLRDRCRAKARAERSLRDLEIVSHRVVDPVSALETRDTLRRLEFAMSRLKPKTRAIFLLHRLDGLSYAQIGERTGLTVKGVEKQMSKAIAKIDRLLERG